MDIRSKEVSDKYREAKKFVEEYEENYHAEINKKASLMSTYGVGGTRFKRSLKD